MVDDGGQASLTSTRAQTPVDRVDHRFWLPSSGVGPELLNLRDAPTLLAHEPHFDQQGLRHSLELLPSLCSLGSASLWMPHKALCRLRNKATPHSAPNFFFSLSLMCRILGPSLNCLSSQGPAFSKLWNVEHKQFPRPQEVLTLQQQRKAVMSSLKPPSVYIQ